MSFMFIYILLHKVITKFWATTIIIIILNVIYPFVY